MRDGEMGDAEKKTGNLGDKEIGDKRLPDAEFG